MTVSYMFVGSGSRYSSDTCLLLWAFEAETNSKPIVLLLLYRWCMYGLHLIGLSENWPFTPIYDILIGSRSGFIKGFFKVTGFLDNATCSVWSLVSFAGNTLLSPTMYSWIPMRWLYSNKHGWDGEMMWNVPKVSTPQPFHRFASRSWPTMLRLPWPRSAGPRSRRFYALAARRPRGPPPMPPPYEPQALLERCQETSRRIHHTKI